MLLNAMSAQRTPYYGRTLITQDTLDNIEDRKEQVLEDPYCDEALKDKIRLSLFRESTISSARIETELRRRKDPNMTPRQKQKLKKQLNEEAEKIGERVSDAWDWAVKNMPEQIDENFITHIASILEPETCKSRTLRNTRALIGDSRVAISPAKLRGVPGYRGYFDIFLECLNNGIIYTGDRDNGDILEISPVEVAAYAHLTNFYLQPCNDSNKRTGRILQNLILMRNDLPPPIIYGPEKDEYIERLFNAFDVRREREGNLICGETVSMEEHGFYEFLGKRVIISLDKMLDSLRKQRKFYIEVTPTDKPLYLSVKRSLLSMMKKRDPESQVRMNPQNRKLYVKGGVEERDLVAVLDSIDGIRKYDVGKHRNYH